MKSFADWTQEIADTVGEVKHHWEEPTPAEDPDAGAVAPNWFDPACPAPPLGSSGSPTRDPSTWLVCNGCAHKYPDVRTAIAPSGSQYTLCDACCRSNGFHRPPNSAAAVPTPTPPLGQSRMLGTYYRSCPFKGIATCPRCGDDLRELFNAGSYGPLCRDCIDEVSP